MNGSGSRCQIAAFIASVAQTCGPSAFDCSNARTSSSCSSSSASAASSFETSLFSACSSRDFFIKLSRTFYRKLYTGQTRFLPQGGIVSIIRGLPMADQRTQLDQDSGVEVDGNSWLTKWMWSPLLTWTCKVTTTLELMFMTALAFGAFESCSERSCDHGL